MFSRIVPTPSLALALALIASPIVHAHGMRIGVAPSQEGVAGRVWYSDETPAAGNAVSLVDAEGRERATTLSDAEGRFAFDKLAAGDYRVVAEGEEGHRAETHIVYAPTSSGHSGAADDAKLAALIRAELQPLREDIARFEQRIRLHDLIGGAGFIVGLCGLYAAWRARRR